MKNYPAWKEFRCIMYHQNILLSLMEDSSEQKMVRIQRKISGLCLKSGFYSILVVFVYQALRPYKHTGIFVISFRNAIGVSNIKDSDQVLYFVESDLGAVAFQRLSVYDICK